MYAHAYTYERGSLIYSPSPDFPEEIIKQFTKCKSKCMYTHAPTKDEVLFTHPTPTPQKKEER